MNALRLFPWKQERAGITNGDAHLRSASLLLLLLLSSCADAHPGTPAPDAAAPDVGPRPCEPRFVDEGDACVAWRAIPPPPCEPLALVRVDGALGILCASGTSYTVSDADTWDEQTVGATPLVVDPVSGPADVTLSPRFAVALSSGERVATHGDVYAGPAAWRTDARGVWRETIPPPGTFLELGAALSADEALFVGRDAYVFTVRHSPR